MKPTAGVKGITPEERVFAKALDELRRSGYRNVRTFSPFPSEDVLAVPDRRQSPIRVYTLAGGILGFLAGLFLTVWTSSQWHLLAGGKPVVSIPPFLVVVFELTILFGGLFTIVGWVIHSGLGRTAGTVPAAAYDVRCSVDRFGIFVPCEGNQSEEVTRLMRAAGMEEISVETP